MKIRLFLIIIISLIYPNMVLKTIDDFVEGSNRKSKDEIQALIKKYNNHDQILVLMGLSEYNGETAVDYFESYYNQKQTDEYMDFVIKKIADFYYARGMYITASKWYEKIPESYPDSKYLKSGINYYINSLLISGNFDEAEDKIDLYKEKFPNILFNENNENISKTEKNKETKLKKNLTFSVEIGNYDNYNTALNYKKMLSKEGFLCRIEDVMINNKKYYSLKIGFYKNKKTANNILKRLKSRVGINTAIIVENN